MKNGSIEHTFKTLIITAITNLLDIYAGEPNFPNFERVIMALTMHISSNCTDGVVDLQHYAPSSADMGGREAMQQCALVFDILITQKSRGECVPANMEFPM